MPSKIKLPNHAIPPSLRLGDLTQHIAITRLKANHSTTNIQEKEEEKRKKSRKRRGEKERKSFRTLLSRGLWITWKKWLFSFRTLLLRKKEEKGGKGRRNKGLKGIGGVQEFFIKEHSNKKEFKIILIYRYRKEYIGIQMKNRIGL